MVLTVVASPRMRLSTATRRGVVVIRAWGLAPIRSASIARSHVDCARCQQASSSAQSVSMFNPRARSGSSPLRQIAQAPLRQVTRRLDGSNLGRIHGGATLSSPEGPFYHHVANVVGSGGDQAPEFHRALLDPALNPLRPRPRLAGPAPRHIAPHPPVARGRPLGFSSPWMRAAFPRRQSAWAAWRVPIPRRAVAHKRRLFRG